MPQLPPAAPPVTAYRQVPDLDPELLRIFGPPPLHEGEDKEAYDALHRRLREAFVPTDIVEEIWIRDIANLVWEGFRLRTLKARLMEVTSARWIEKALAKAMPGHRNLKALLDDYGRGVPEARKRVDTLLRDASIDRGNIEAQTLWKQLSDFDGMDLSIMRNEARRNATFREMDRHRDAVARLRRAVAEIEDAKFEAAPPPSLYPVPT